MKFYLDVNDRVCFALVNDNNFIVTYNECDFSNDILNILYTYLKSFAVDELVVLTHGVIGESLLGNAGIIKQVFLKGKSSIYCQVPIADAEKIAHLAKVADVGKVAFVDRIGYYTTFGEDKCYVENENGLYSLIAVKEGSVVDYSRCSTTINSVAQRMCRQAGITSCVDAHSLQNFDLLMNAFPNIHCIADPHALGELSLFAYSVSECAADYTASLTELCDSVEGAKFAENVIKELHEESGEATEELVPVPKKHAAKSTVAKSKKAGYRKFTAPEVKYKKTALDYVCVVLSVLLILVTAGSAAGSYALTTKNLASREELTRLESSMERYNKELAKYQHFEKFGTLNPEEKVIYDYLIHSAEFSGEILLIDVNKEKADVVFTCTTKESLERIMSDFKLVDENYVIYADNMDGMYTPGDIDYLDESKNGNVDAKQEVEFVESQPYRVSFSL